MEEYGFDWKKFLVLGLIALLLGATYYVKYTENGATRWNDYWNPQVQVDEEPPVTVQSNPVTYKVNNNGIVETWTQKPGNDYEVIDGIYVQTQKGSNDKLLDPPTLTVVDVQEKSAWTDTDGIALPEIIKVGSQVLYLQAASMSTEFGAIALQSLVDSDDKFQKAFQSAKEDSFSAYLRNSESLWGDAVGRYEDNDNKYVAYLVKVSTGKYGLWYITPDTTSGSIPDNKDDLKSITPYVESSAEAGYNNPPANPTPASETKPGDSSGTPSGTPTSSSEVSTGRGTTSSTPSSTPTSASDIAKGRG